MLPRHRVLIHCWGGYGSQLLALALYIDLRAIYPKRKFGIVFHTSGVTRRTIEIKQYLNNCEYTQIDDFIAFRSSIKKRDFFRSMFKKFLISTGLIVTDHRLEKAPRILPWTIALRGHYLYRPISKKVLSQFTQFLLKGAASTNMPSIFIHYRLGDLISLHDKTFIHPMNITRLIDEFSENFDSSHVVIGTENPSTAKKLLSNNKILREARYANFNPDQTLQIGMNASYFIGTNSKLSLWISLLRANFGKKSLMPEEFRETLKYTFGDNVNSRIGFYSSTNQKVLGSL